MNSLSSISSEHKSVYFGPFVCSDNRSINYSSKAIKEKIKQSAVMLNCPVNSDKSMDPVDN